MRGNGRLTVSFHTLLHNIRSALAPGRGQRNHSRAVRRAARYLSLEDLENRCLLSTFTVLNLADSGEGSLRQGILDANSNPGADVIGFADGLLGTVALTSGQLS